MPTSSFLFQELAGLAAQEFLQNSKPLNEKIAQLAQEHNLNSHEVMKLCQETNKAVQIALFAAGDDRTHEFKLAEYRDILSSLNQAIPVFDAPEPSSGKEDLKKVASRGRKPSEIRELRAELATMENVAVDLLSRTKEAEIDIKKQASKFVQVAKNRYLDGKSLEKIAEELATLRPLYVPAINQLCKMAAASLRCKYEPLAEDFQKVAHSKLEELINPKQEISTPEPGHEKLPPYLLVHGNRDPIKVIVGDQDLLMILDTTVEQASKKDENLAGYWYVRDKIKFVTTEIRDRLSSETSKGI